MAPHERFPGTGVTVGYRQLRQGVGRRAASLRLWAVVALLVALTACSPGTDDGGRGTGGEPRSGTPRPQTTATEGAAGTSSGLPDRLDYVALGDSLAVGVGAERGYVDRYADYLRNDTGAGVRVVNLGVSGQTASQLLESLGNDASIRDALRGAEVVTFNIGINDLGRAHRSYQDGTCGGPDDEECLRAAVGAFERDWDAVTAEILRLRPPDEAVVHTAGLGYTPDVDGVFEPYVAEANRHIAASADDKDIPYAEVRLGAGGISADGLHPNDEGYQVIADKLRALGYEPLDVR